MHSKKTPAERLETLLGNNTRVLDEAPTRTPLGLVHPFPAPMSDRLAETVIARTTTCEEVVLDPMAGSGTVPAAALTLGRPHHAMDIDPLAVMTMRVRCADYSVDTVLRAGERVLRAAHKLRADHARLDRFFSDRFDADTQIFINRWFPLRVRRGLLAIWQAITEVAPAQTRLPLKVAFSRLIIAKTAGTSRAIDLPHTRPHRDPLKTVPDPLTMFPYRLKELARRLSARPVITRGVRSDIRGGDVRALPYGDGSIDLVLTSAPYANAIDYMRAHRFSLVWMGYSLSRLARIRSRMIGAERGLLRSDQDLDWIEEHLPHVPDHLSRRIAIQRRFFHDLDMVIHEFHRVLKPGGACVFVLGKSFVSGHIIDTPTIVAKIGEGRGFTHVGTAYRDLNPLRRSLPFPRAGTAGALGKRMGQEAVVALAR